MLSASGGVQFQPWQFAANAEAAADLGGQRTAALAARRRWWDADTESIKADTADRLQQGRGAQGLVDPALPAELKAEGITE